MGYALEYSMQIDPYANITVPDMDMTTLTRQSNLRIRHPAVETWGYDVVHKGPRSLFVATFSRDMWWEVEVDKIYDDLVARGYEYALIEDLITLHIDPIYNLDVRRGQVFCLGSPIVGDLNPLMQSIRDGDLHFSPYEGCLSKRAKILVAPFEDQPTLRSPHFPFPDQPDFRPPHPTPSQYGY